MNFWGCHKILSAAKSSLRQLRRNATSISTSTPPGKCVQVSSFNIHYEIIGTGKNIVFLMPGAMGSTRTDFPAQLDKLNREKFTIVAWDPPGQGFSRPPDRTYPLDFFHSDADVARQLINKLGIPKLSVIGWSDGGITGLVFAAQNPNLVQKLVVFGANAFITEDDIKLYEYVRDIDKWSARMRAPMVDVYGEDYFRTKWGEWIDAMQRIFKEKQGDICKRETREITCPTLIIHGKKDPMVPQFHPDFLKANIKNSSYIEYEDGKHNLHLQFQDRFNKNVEDFLIG